MQTIIKNWRRFEQKEGEKSHHNKNKMRYVSQSIANFFLTFEFWVKKKSRGNNVGIWGKVTPRHSIPCRDTTFSTDWMTLTRIFCSCAVIFHVFTVLRTKKLKIFLRFNFFLCLTLYNLLWYRKRRKECTEGWLIYPLECFVVITVKLWRYTMEWKGGNWQHKNMKRKEKRCSKVNNKLCWRLLSIFLSMTCTIQMNTVLFDKVLPCLNMKIRQVDVLTTEFK